jgi:hypothetical protein
MQGDLDLPIREGDGAGIDGCRKGCSPGAMLLGTALLRFAAEQVGEFHNTSPSMIPIHASNAYIT